MGGAAAIEVEDLRHRYGSEDEPVVVLDGISFRAPAAGYVALRGVSGAGKSTLLSIVGGLEAPQSGAVVVGGAELHGLSRDALAAFRRETVGFVFQHFGLLDVMSARENVELAMVLAGVERRARRARADELLAEVGLEHRLDHRAAHLSGGERQRVAIARALANEPSLVLADEPTGNLDRGSAETVMSLLERLRAERGCTLLVATHSDAVASRADQQLALDDGRLTRSDPA